MASKSSPPRVPADPEIVRNIEVLAAFVAKAGAQFEQLARANTAGDPKFGFLVDGNPAGSEAALAHEFYEWKKRRLEQRIFASDGSDDLQLKICAMVDDGLAPLKPPPLTTFAPAALLPSDTHALDVTPAIPSHEREQPEATAAGQTRMGALHDAISDPKATSNPPHHIDVTRAPPPPLGDDEKKQSETNVFTNRKIGSLDKDGLIGKTSVLAPWSAQDGMKASTTTGPQKKQPDSSTAHRGSKDGVTVENSSAGPNQALCGARDRNKQPRLTTECKRPASSIAEAPKDDPNKKSSHPGHGGKEDIQHALLAGNHTKHPNTIDGAAVNFKAPKHDPKGNAGGPSNGAPHGGDVKMEQQAAVDGMADKHAKEAYAMKLLKAVLAEYVKEVLKPAWKEGSMSKDAFKAIVKKVVEKVIDSIQSHQIPKSQENVDQFMAVSKPKIAKLVQGYVDKFKKG